MKYETGICRGCGVNKMIINKTYKLCPKCNRMRLDNEKTDTKEKPKYIKPRSAKRAEQEKEYSQIKKEKTAYLKNKKILKCLCCNVRLDEIPDDLWSYHHLTGRDSDLLAEWTNIEPVHNTCHSDLHHKTVAQLLNTPWYGHFCERLKSRAEKNPFMKEAYNKELRRQQKAEVIDMEMYLNLFIT